MLELRNVKSFELIDSIYVAEPVAGVTVTDQHIAYSSYKAANIHLLDPGTKKVVATIRVEGNPTGITWDGQFLWYCDHTNVALRAIEVSQFLPSRPRF